MKNIYFTILTSLALFYKQVKEMHQNQKQNQSAIFVDFITRFKMSRQFIIIQKSINKRQYQFEYTRYCVKQILYFIIVQQLFKKQFANMPKLDPLQLLRSAYNTKKSQKKLTTKLKGTDLYFDRDVKLPLDTQTAWQSTKTGKQFNLGSIWLYLQLHFQKIAGRSQYFKKASQLGLDTIGVADSDEIIKYFTGEIDESACINNQLKQLIAQKNKGRDKPVTGGQQNFDKVEKKLKAESNLDQTTQHLLKCLNYLNQFEKPISSKSRCFKSPNKKFYSILTHLIQNQNKQTSNSPQHQKAEKKQGTKLKIASIYENKRLPIIIVPPQTIPGNISLHNIEKFLTKGQYDEYDRLAKEEASRTQFMRVTRGKNIMYQIHSRPELLSEKDWECVVGIFVLGRDNQFEHWPYKTHKKIFEQIPGFMVKFPKTPLGSASNWKCTVKTLDPISRISDKQVVREIWQQIQKYMFSKV